MQMEKIIINSINLAQEVPLLLMTKLITITIKASRLVLLVVRRLNTVLNVMLRE
jgi:hypothetical protein